MSKPTRITLVRHGEVHNPAGVYYGRLPRFGLSVFGRELAMAAGRQLRYARPVALYTSPLLRARQTAALIAAQGLNLKPTMTRLLLEVYSPYDGLTQQVLASQNWDLYAGAGPEFEQPGDILARVLRFFERIRDQYSGRHVVAVTHGDLIAFSILWAAGLPVTAEGRARLSECGVIAGYPSLASLTTFAFTPGQERPALNHRLAIPGKPSL
mgnify:CR=1 FL=1